MSAVWGDGGLSAYLKPVPNILLNYETSKEKQSYHLIPEMGVTVTTIPHRVQASVKVCQLFL